MYIVLAAQFEHLIHPLTILLSLPLSIPFGLISLYYGGETLNVYSALGILVLFGVVKKAGILQSITPTPFGPKGWNAPPPFSRRIATASVDFDDDHLVRCRGCYVADCEWTGAEERRSIAVLAAGGQTLSLLLTLLAVPIIYSYLDDIGNLFRRKQDGRTL